MVNEVGFEAFWRAYPRRVGKGEARKVWGRLKVSAQLQEAMMQALTWQVHQPQWRKDGGTFIPHPATWLRQERWLDEPVQGRAGLRGGGVLAFPQPAPVAVIDPDYNGQPYRFHCAHTPACTRWPEHRDHPDQEARTA